jgi:hypothetical protein
MAFSVSYDQLYGKKSKYTPFDDWSRRYGADAIFTYYSHWGTDIHKYMHFMPLEKIMFIEYNGEYYDIDLYVEVDINETNSTVTIRKLLCQTKNYWPKIYTDEVPKVNNDNGGISWYKRHDECFNGISIEEHVERLFGPSWNVIMPLTVPKPSSDQIDFCKKCREIMSDYQYGPWDHLVGRYLTFGKYANKYNSAATVIQKHFRAWRVRFAIDPNTDLGRYIEMSRWKRWMVEDII